MGFRDARRVLNRHRWQLLAIVSSWVLAGAACSADETSATSGAGSGASAPGGGGAGGSGIGGSGIGGSGIGGSAGGGAAAIASLGVYTVKTDGSQLTLLSDTGAQLYTHVRGLQGSDWLTATRYSLDKDGNGLAMEGEGGAGPNYDGTEIIFFRRGAPNSVHVLPAPSLNCGTDTTVCANSSWTADGKLLLLSKGPSSGNSDWLKRITLDSLPPTTAAVEALTIPSQIVLPVDPHQHGDSTTGTIVFSGTFNQGTAQDPKWMRPVFKMPATGTAVFGPNEVEFVGCATCASEGGACCSEIDPSAIMGTNDARLSHDGTKVLWMQANREESADIFGVTLHPYRQFSKAVTGGSQVALNPGMAAPTTTQAYGEWSPDDTRIAYWEIIVSGDTPATFRVSEKLFLADADGTNRGAVPLPNELCAAHPSYLDADTLIFSGWRCGGENCSCAPEKL